VEFSEWRIYYEEILKDFGFSREKDEEAARLLAHLLKDREPPTDALDALLRGRSVTVAGNAPDLADHLGEGEGVWIAADEASSVLKDHGRFPAVIVTDLDGIIPEQIALNRQGAIVVIHAHGDNIPALRRWVPDFSGPVLGTAQCKPPDGLFNFGGFTDGDRAVFLAHHFEALEIHLRGFDFENVNPKEEDPARKARKLDWAYLLIMGLDDPRIRFEPSSS